MLGPRAPKAHLCVLYSGDGVSVVQNYAEIQCCILCYAVAAAATALCVCFKVMFVLYCYAYISATYVRRLECVACGSNVDSKTQMRRRSLTLLNLVLIPIAYNKTGMAECLTYPYLNLQVRVACSSMS